MTTRSRKTPAKIGAAIALAAALSLTGPAMAAQADMVRGGSSSTSASCWQARNYGVSLLQSQGFLVTYAGRCILLNDGYWHFTLRYVVPRSNH